MISTVYFIGVIVGFIGVFAIYKVISDNYGHWIKGADEWDGLEALKAEPIVRCKDCKWYYDDTKYCDKWGDVFVYWSDHSPVPSNGYCFMAERKNKVTE